MKQQFSQSQSDIFKQAQNSRALVKFENVFLNYNKFKEAGNNAFALNDVSLELQKGGFYFLTGPSGAGKSTLLKLMYLALRPTRGKLEMFGVDVGDAERDALPELRRKIGVVFQDFRLLPHLSIFDNLSLPFRVRNLPLGRYQADVKELLEWVGLGKRMYSLPETLSGGEQQRVAIARAVVGKPQLIIADEPTGNVDPQMGTRLLRLFVELNKLGTTVVIATHDHEMVRRSGAPVLRIHKGKLEQFDFPPENLGG